MELIRNQPFDGFLRATVLFPRGCVANMGNIGFGMTARFISGSHLLHTQRKEVMAHDERKLDISPWRYLLR